jgi:hypothetical protein
VVSDLGSRSGQLVEQRFCADVTTTLLPAWLSGQQSEVPINRLGVLPEHDSHALLSWAELYKY